MGSTLFRLLLKMTAPFRGTGIVQRSTFFARLHRGYRFAYNLLFPRKISLYGRTMFLDEEDNIELARCLEKYEPETTNAFKNILKTGDMVVDIGSNIGYYSLLSALLVGEKGLVLALEPDPRFLEPFRRTVSVNPDLPIHLVPSAASDTANSSVSFISPGTLKIESTPPEPGKTEISVSTVSLDSVLEEYSSSIALIKMDIEGSEPKALAGMVQTIQRNPNLALITEYHPRLLESNGFSPQEYLGKIASFGFVLYDIDRMEASGEARSIDYFLSTYGPSTHPDHTNILCLHPETKKWPNQK